MIDWGRVLRGVGAALPLLLIAAVLVLLTACSQEHPGFACYGNADCCVFHHARIADPDTLEVWRAASVSALADMERRGVACTAPIGALTPELCELTVAYLAMPGRASQSMVRAWRIQLAACQRAGLVGAL